METLGQSWAAHQLYSGFVVIDAPSLGLMGLKYSVMGLSPSRTEALKHLERMIEKRNGLAPGEKMYVDLATFKWPVTEETTQADKMLALKKLPSGMSAFEMCNGDPGRVFNQSIASLLKESEEIDDINSILT